MLGELIDEYWESDENTSGNLEYYSRIEQAINWAQNTGGAWASGEDERRVANMAAVAIGELVETVHNLTNIEIKNQEGEVIDTIGMPTSIELIHAALDDFVPRILQQMIDANKLD